MIDCRRQPRSRRADPACEALPGGRAAGAVAEPHVVQRGREIGDWRANMSICSTTSSRCSRTRTSQGPAATVATPLGVRCSLDRRNDQVQRVEATHLNLVRPRSSVLSKRLSVPRFLVGSARRMCRSAVAGIATTRSLVDTRLASVPTATQMLRHSASHSPSNVTQTSSPGRRARPNT
jgi:hypothetical protein